MVRAEAAPQNSNLTTLQTPAFPEKSKDGHCSESETRGIEELLATGGELPVPDLLMLDAEASLAAVHAFQALELFLEEFPSGRLEAAGLDAQGELRTVWQTKERLKVLARKATETGR